jgi:CBS domain-containing protein
MKVSDAMTRDVRIASPEETIADAAKAMAALDAGVLPVGDNDRLIGMITDRDIAVRAVAEGKGADTPIREIMTPEVKYCFEDEDLDHVALNMGDIRVRRLPVLNRDKLLVGIVSLGDIAMVEGRGISGSAIKDISRPGGPHSQTAHPH